MKIRDKNSMINNSINDINLLIKIYFQIQRYILLEILLTHV